MKPTGLHVVFQHKVSQGELIGGSLPIGYKKVDGRAVIDEETAPIARDLFDYFELHNSKRHVLFNEKIWYLPKIPKCMLYAF